MLVLQGLTLVLWVSLTSAELCNLTNLLGPHGKGGKYFSVDRDNVCYVFALHKVAVNEAQNFCRSIGGRLTDVEATTNNSLQKMIIEEMKNNTEMNTDYWTGLLWNPHLGVWYWDTDLIQNLDLNSLSKPWSCTWRSRACVSMTSAGVGNYICRDEKAFICKIDLDCHIQEVADNSSCTPRCVDYIRQHRTTPLDTSSTTTTTSPWIDSTAASDVVTNTTHDDKDNGRCAAQVNAVQECHAENKLFLTALAVLGALTGMLTVATIVLCTRISKYRGLLNDKATATRISMVDILHADSPAASRRKRPGNDNNSLPGSTSELLYTNPDNNYSTPESEGGQATEASDFIYQENGYSSPSEPLAPGNEADVESHPARAGNEYTFLNRRGELLQETDGQNVYGEESASQPLTDQRKISDTYETYANQH